MSMVQDAHERDQNNTAKLNIIQALIDTDKLEGPSLGIAKKILSGDSISNLSSKQLYVYNKEIAIHFEAVCTNGDCDNHLELEDIADAILEEEYICQNCIYFSEQMLKDD